MAKKIEYYVVDVETTGFSPKYHEVTEVSFIRCRDLHELTRKIKPLYPKRVNPKALSATGRTMADLYVGHSKEHVVGLVEKFFAQDEVDSGARCMIAHNHTFDKNFLEKLWRDLDKIFPVEIWFDTKILAKAWAKKLGTPWPDYKLQNVLDRTGTRVDAGAHNASSDARNTFLLWKKGTQDMGLDHFSCLKRYDIKK